MRSTCKRDVLLCVRGQALVELTLCLPILLLLLLSIVYFGKAFYATQVVCFATQQGAMTAAKVPDLSNEEVRDQIRGFTVAGQTVNKDSLVYRAFANAQLLSHGNTGDLPAGSKVMILPWDGAGDAGAAGDGAPPAGTVSVSISYPFHLLGDNSQREETSHAIIIPLLKPHASNSGSPNDDNTGSKHYVSLSDFTITHQSTVAQEVSQEDN